MTIEVSPLWELGALLGEGPLWIPEERALRFVDIKAGRLHRFDPVTGRGTSFDCGGNPSFIVPVIGGGYCVGSGSMLHASGGETLGPVVATIEQPGHNRTNDGTVDGNGRLWFGTMDDEEYRQTGAIWCFDGGMLTKSGGEAVVTNGPAISLDDRWIYRVDSPQRTIWRHRLGESCLLNAGEPFVTIEDGEGYPDGIVIDSEDCLWVALWDGWGVRRYDPAGAMMLHVALPCARVTKLALGGPDLRTAFVTTARIGLERAWSSEQPLAGSLFAFEAPAAGRELPKLKYGSEVIPHNPRKSDY